MPAILPTIETARVTLRDWRLGDFAAFAALNADPLVARYLPCPLTSEQSRAFLERITEHIVRHGLGLFAMTLRGEEQVVGYCGLNHPAFTADFTPCTEIGWRLSPALWNQGLTTEAAEAVLEWGFVTRKLAEIVSFTTVANAPSRRVMEKLGMTRNPAEDFLHPVLPAEHPLAPHVLYRLSAATYFDRQVRH